jgi:uncharacterized RDD family membrane protein YckC
MYCSRCGVQMTDASQYCPACGQPTGTPASAGGFSPAPPEATTVYAPAIPATPAPTGAPPAYGGTVVSHAPYALSARVGYAGFWLRVVALFIDGIIIDVVLGVPFFFLLAGSGILSVIRSGGPPEDYLGQFFGVFAVLEIGCFAAAWLYSALFESSSWQATPGKRALGLYVTDMAGQRISFGRASGRFFAKMISGLTMMIGYLMAGFTERKQALHDLIAGTLVLRKL